VGSGKRQAANTSASSLGLRSGPLGAGNGLSVPPPRSGVIGYELLEGLRLASGNILHAVGDHRPLAARHNEMQLHERRHRRPGHSGGRQFSARHRAPPRSTPNAGRLWQLIQTDFYANQRMIVESIHRAGGLRPGLGVTHAADILWTLNHPDVWKLLVEKRGWPPRSYETWLAESSCAQLLGTPIG
jgi:hypothetical protein